MAKTDDDEILAGFKVCVYSGAQLVAVAMIDAATPAAATALVAASFPHCEVIGEG